MSSSDIRPRKKINTGMDAALSAMGEGLLCSCVTDDLSDQDHTGIGQQRRQTTRVFLPQRGCMKINLKALSAIGLLTAAGAAMAADEPAAPAAPTGPSLASVLEASGITATGYVAASYDHLSTIGGSSSLHQFDTNHNTFELNQAALTLGFQPKEGFGAVVSVMGGQDASVLNTAEGNSGFFNVTQGYVQYASGGFTVIGGKFLTLAGAEVIAANGNTNISRSLLFTNLEPLTHTGIRGTYAPSEMVSFSLGLNNGWNVTSDSNTQKTVEANVTVTPIAALSIGLTGYFGHEDAPGVTAPGNRTLIDLVATWKATDALTFILNYDNLSVKDFPVTGTTAKSDGIALYGNWAINDMWRLSLRLEQTSDDGSGGLITGVKDAKVKEATITVGFDPTKNTEIAFEIRQDKSDHNLFTSFGSPTADSDNQTEFVLQAFYKF
jgi:hypothetical protein